MAKRRPAGGAGLPLELVDWLLTGGTRSVAEIDALEAQGIAYDPWIEFDVPGPDLRALWTAHRAALLAEWHRRGGTGQPWAAREFDR